MRSYVFILVLHVTRSRLRACRASAPYHSAGQVLAESFSTQQHKYASSSTTEASTRGTCYASVICAKSRITHLPCCAVLVPKGILFLLRHSMFPESACQGLVRM